ncbi:energy-coupling factor transport system permease protein [Isobaculum melis]|uniref:Energy-coupling factor transport system permease protein n=2 Tax=Isobaculum melis TaxID=142588 RepID=A0A1H9T3N5_9LACT|nr:energy-coupling factor transport system permease protein [Isobaculum melis]
MRIKFDPRSKLCTILFASVLLMLHLSFPLEIFFVTLLFFLFLLNGDLKKGLIYYIIFWLLVLGDYFILPYVQNTWLSLLSFLFVGNRRLLPTIMAASFGMSHTKISEWIAALKKMGLPFAIIIPLTVLFRFFPTVIQDFKSIRSAMKYRGIAVTTLDLLIHPLQTMEYIIIPILMSAENTSLDLSAAALVRGIANPGKHTSVYEIKLRVQDYLLISVLIFALIGGRWLQ